MIQKLAKIFPHFFAFVVGLAVGVAMPIAFGWVHAPITAAHADEMSDEVKMGKDAVDQIAKNTKFVTDPAAVARVNAVGAKLAVIADTTQIPARFGNDRLYNFKYTYTIIDDKEVNAFSLPGGFIYIYKGLLDLLQSDDELAAVLGHETAHAAHHHVSQLTHEQSKMSSQMAIGLLVALLAKVPADQIGSLAGGVQYAQMAILNNHFSEAAEQDADHTGMIYMTKAGYNPLGMLSMLDRLEDVEKRSPQLDLGFLQDHPLTPDRIAAAKSELSTLGYSVDPKKVWLVANPNFAHVTDISSNHNEAVKLSFSNRQIAILAPANRMEAEKAAKVLETLPGRNAQGYQIQVAGSQVIACGQPILNFTPADVAVQTVPTTPEEMATSAKQVIKDALWDVNIRGIAAP